MQEKEVTEAATPTLVWLNYTPSRIAELLDGTHWANSLSWNQLVHLGVYFKAYEAPKGAVIFQEGQVERSMGIIVSGQIDITKADQQLKATVLARLRAGQTFGEMSLIDDEPRSATAVAASDSVILFITKDNFLRLSRELPPLAFAVLWKVSRQLSQRLRRASGQLVDYLGGNQ